jgi:hypothetical protein
MSPAEKQQLGDRKVAARKALEFLLSSKLIDLNQSIGTFMGGFGKIADDVDGYGICYKAYHFIVFNPHAVDVVQPGELTRGAGSLGVERGAVKEAA